MAFIDKIKERAKADKKTIVLPESMDKRTYEAAEKILKEGIANLIIIGTPEEIEKNGKGFDISGATIVDPYNDPNKQKYIDKFVELRGKKGVTPEVAKEQMEKDYMYYACLMCMPFYRQHHSSGSAASEDQTGYQLCIWLLPDGSSGLRVR